MSDQNTAPSDQRSAEVERIPGKFGGTLTPWKKGQSGNPTGAQGEYHRVRSLCANESMGATKTLIGLMKDEEGDQRVRYMAAMAILDRGIGKPRDHSQDGESVMDLTKLNEGERRLLLELMSRVLGVEMPK